MNFMNQMKPICIHAEKSAICAAKVAREGQRCKGLSRHKPTSHPPPIYSTIP
jgi:hypothetical protein